ncbi:hypothetical protein DY000_02030703 [Brassica cretica]|uniref:Uncharacterized protein n=1 Tax=Brassica cretica TaxID=69181 RepID=A0ABQ7DS76_BRACR|nr:hypothetical protein DY000_02030703 [Brassica cretica]
MDCMASSLLENIFSRFSLSEVSLFPEEGVVSGTGPGVLPSGDLGRLLAGTQRPRTRGITCAPNSIGVAHSQQASPEQDIAPTMKPGAFSGALEITELGALVISEEEA